MLESKNNKQRTNLSKRRFFLLSLLLVTVLLTVILSSCFLLNKPPHKPTLSYPKNLANEIPTTDLTLKWSCFDPDSNKLNYTLYLSPSLTPTLYATNIISNQYTIHKTLKGHTLYSWKVIANDGHGAKSSSDIYKFTTSDNPPTKPALAYPDNNQTDVATSNLTLKWNPSTDPDGDPITYDLYLSTNSNPTIYATNITDTQYTIFTLQHGTLYSWKVIAKDDHGAKSSSDIYKFTTSDNPPTQPTLTYPDNNQTDVATSSLTLKWNSSTDPDGDPITYDLYLSTDSNPKLYKSSLTDIQYTIPTALNGHTTYSWKVIANDGHGAKSSSDIYKFTTSDNPPTKPILSSPKNSATNVNTNTLFKWNSSTDPDGDPITYDLYLSTDSNPKLYKSSLTDTQFTVSSTLKGHTTYYWKVIANDGHGAKSSSDIYKFTTSDNPPTKPTLTYPDNNQTDVATSSLTLKWNPSTDPDGDPITYDLYLSTDSNPKLYKSSLTSNQFVLTNLKHGTLYSWKVIANDDHGAKSSSGIYKFTTSDNPPTKPTLTYPDNNQTDVATSSLTLKWNPSTDPDGDPITYDLYLSTDSNPKLYKSSLTSTSLLVKGLKSGRSYHWKIVAYDGLVKRTSSDIYTFSTVDTPPTIQLLSPGNYTTTTTPFSVTLSWRATDTDGNSLTYDVYLSKTSEDLKLYKSGILTSSYTIKNLENGTTYYWKVVADDSVEKTSSEVRAFTTYDNPPDEPKLLAPNDGSMKVLPSSADLKWSCSDPDGDTLTYDLYLSTDSNPSFFKADITSPEYKATSLSSATTYYWKVVAKDGKKKLTSSKIFHFTTVLNNGDYCKWKYQTDDGIGSSPAIDFDGTVYVGSKDYYLYAINPDGTLKWKYETGYYIYSSPAIASDGTVYVGSYDDYLYAINPDGTLKWKYETSDIIRSSPAIASDGTVYVGSYDDYLYAINPDGTLKWKYGTGGGIGSSPAIASDGTVYVGSDDNYLYAINPDGTLKWKYKTDSYIYSSPAIASDGTIYVGSYDDYLYAINPDGTLKWKYETSDIIRSSPAIASDGTVYVGSYDDYLYAINPDGTLKWKYKTDSYIYSSLAIASDGTVYVGSDDNYLYAINPDGTLKWKYGTGGGIGSSPAIASDGTIYVGSYDDYLYAIKTNNGGLADSPWPMFGHDLKHLSRSINLIKENNSPTVSLVSPADNLTGLSTSSITFEWNGSDPDGDTLTYDLYLSEDSTPLFYKSDITQTKYVFNGALKPNTVYYWRIAAKDGKGLIAFSEIFSFKTRYLDGTLKWKYGTDYGIYSSPAIASDGTVYVGSDDNYLYAINPDGTLKWKYETSGDIDSSPAIASDGTIYVGSYDDYLYAINPDGTLKWKYKAGNDIRSSPAIASDGTVYVGSYDDYLYAINPDGTLKWKYETGYYICSSPAIASDGTVYVGSYDHYLYAINPDGTLKWKYETGYYICSSPAIASDGTVYVGSYDDYLYAINPDGTLKWKYGTGNDIFSSPAIASDGTVYVGSHDDYLYAINPDGTLKWKYKTDSYISSSPAIASDGTVYVGSYDDYLYAINPDGTLKWKYGTGNDIFSSPAIASDGTVYVGNTNTDYYYHHGCLYAIETYNGGLANTPWPIFHHDLKHTGRK